MTPSSPNPRHGPKVKTRPCYACGGTGKVLYEGTTRTCPSCLGVGWKWTKPMGPPEGGEV